MQGHGLIFLYCTAVRRPDIRARFGMYYGAAVTASGACCALAACVLFDMAGFIERCMPGIAAIYHCRRTRQRSDSLCFPNSV